MNTLQSITLAVLAGLTVSAPAAGLVANPGDLLLGFFQLNAEGTGVESNTCVVNLGPGSTWRENTDTTVMIGNINDDLENAFGPGWAENPQLRCGIVGAVGATDPVTAGDPARTTYFSQGAASFAAGLTTPVIFSSSQRGSLSTRLSTFRGATNGKPAGSNPAAAVIGTSENSNFASFLPPLETTYFGVGASPLASFGPGNIGAADGYNAEVALDVYRVLHSATGADLTAGLSAGNAAVGTGQFIGMFTIDSAGNVRLDTPASTPVAGYSAWADTNSLTGADRDPAADPDKDRIPNAVEFVIGGNPRLGGDGAKLPALSVSGGFAEFVFRRTDASAYLNPVVEHDADLAGVWTTAVNGAGGIVISEADNFYDSSTDKVTVRMPVSDLKHFLRLRVTVP